MIKKITKHFNELIDKNFCEKESLNDKLDKLNAQNRELEFEIWNNIFEMKRISIASEKYSKRLREE